MNRKCRYVIVKIWYLLAIETNLYLARLIQLLWNRDRKILEIITETKFTYFLQDIRHD